MKILTITMIFLSLTLNAAIFGFFFAWVCSTMWGLDAADPRVAIEAMQAMNASVRNAVFAPAFFGTPVALGLTAILLYIRSHHLSAAAFAGAAVTYFCLGLVLTMMVNVPMNEALAGVTVSGDAEEARRIWSDYSGRWQVWNQIRSIGSLTAFLLALAGVLRIDPRSI
ncbi:anthrone oxygenase family protein [Paracoccus onubensis]|uniref:DUF1772 domain-containing protein n=1 Tax=Paracoccus onubensis TaxID=1675788 RepID=A0A418SN58_9RHOB|nr:anthrone oxygenase family protein [Paracoccus onubensis]RJE82375.1 DUF1772 domain-containing protein [Paracoccus onubensis]